MPVSSAVDSVARKNLTSILRGLAEVSQVRVADLMGVSEATVSRMKDGDLEKFSTLLAACGLKVCSATSQAYDPDYIRSLQVMAKVGLDAPAPKLDWE